MALIADFVTGKPVTFRRVRHLLAQMGLQEGVVGAGDLKAAQRAAGANMSVDVAAGEAWVAVDTGTRNGIAHLTNDAVANVIVPASDATNPTVHSIVAQYNDTAIPAGAGGDDPTFRLIAGTPTAGATLDNRNGAPGGAGGPAMPADALLLADVLVPAASTSVVTGNIRDRRRWARGAHWVEWNTGGNITTASSSYAAMTNARRVELSGAPLRIEVIGRYEIATAGHRAQFTVRDSASNNPIEAHQPVGTASLAGRSGGDNALWNSKWVAPPAASVVLTPEVRAVDSTSVTVFRQAGVPLGFMYEEIIRQNSTNG